MRLVSFSMRSNPIRSILSFFCSIYQHFFPVQEVLPSIFRIKLSQGIPNGRAVYDDTAKELLSDDISKFFVNLRNISEKQVYLPLSFRLLESSYEENDPRNVWTQRGPSTPPSTPSRKHLAWVEDLLMDTASWPRASYIRPQWYIDDFPQGREELVDACETYLKNLRSFIEKLRDRLV